MIVAQGGLVVLAGKIQERTGSFTTAWTLVFALVAGIFFLFSLYHGWVLPRPAGDAPGSAEAREKLRKISLAPSPRFSASRKSAR